MNTPLLYLILTVAGLFVATPVHADDTVTLSWDPNPERDVVGYRIYMSTKSGQYGAPIADIKKTKTTYKVIVKATNDTRYYFKVTAYNKAGKESANSKEVSKIIKGTPPVASTR